MIVFSSVEEAYNTLAKDTLAFPNGRTWTKVCGEYKVYSKMVSCRWWLENNNTIDRKWANGSDQFNKLACDAALFLRDDLLSTTGERIWGLTFTLYPTGKFEIEYDYNKPEGYEESDETISGLEVNESLNQLLKV